MLSPLEVIDAGVFTPCEVVLKTSGKTEQVFSCTQVFRLLPGRRMTCLATSGKNQYVVKLFPGRNRCQQDYESEVQGHGLLHNAAFDVPARIYHGPVQENMLAIIYQYLPSADTLLGLADPEKEVVKSTMKRLLDLVIRLHRDHFVHDDPHLGNFLAKGRTLYVLDTGAVRRVSNDALLIDNFGLFVAQFPMSLRIEEDWVSKYCDALNPDNQAEVRPLLYKAIQDKRDWRERHVLKKIYRECTGYHVDSSIYGKTIVNKDYQNTDIAEIISRPERLFLGNETMLKEGNSSTVGVITTADSDYVVKRYNIKNPIQWLKRVIGESRASRSWRNAHRLLLRGIPTARPVGIYECMKGNMRGVSVIAMEYLQGTHSADFFLQTRPTDDQRRVVAENILSLIAELKRQQITHGDLKSTNFILANDRTYLVDLDAMRLHSSDISFKKHFAKDMARFRNNWIGDEKTAALFESLYEKYGLA